MLDFSLKSNKWYFPLDANRFNKKLKDTVAVEREKLVLDVELQDQTAPAIFFFNGNRIEPNERVEIKNLGGGKHQLIFNRLEMSDDGEISCESGQLKSSCKLTVKKGESKPIVEIPDKVEGPCNTPLVFVVPYKSKFLFTFYYKCCNPRRRDDIIRIIYLISLEYRINLLLWLI